MIKTIAMAIALLGPVASAAGQGGSTAKNLPVAIVMVEELPFPQARAVVIRRKNMEPQNIVLVTERTAAGDLSRAMSTLAASRRKKGDQVSTDLVAPITENRSPKASKDYALAEKDLKRLRSTKPRFVEGVGARPVLFSHLRPPTPRAPKH